jgi:hypothetical protein
MMMTRSSLLLLFVAAVQGQQNSSTNFTGPGLVGCPETAFMLSPCAVDLPDACASRSDCQSSSQLPNITGFVLIELPCDCATISGCPSTCEFSDVPAANGNGTGLDFTGPGYLSCDLMEWENTGGCGFLDLNPLCPSLSSCSFNSSGQIPSVDSTGTTLYIPLFCECFEALDCPASCTKSDGDPPQLTPVSATLNFTGVGIVTCPIVDFITVQTQGDRQCIPSVLNRNFSSCGSCNISSLDTMFESGDEFLSIPLLCDCLSLFGCPDTCTFEAGLGSPIAIGSNATASPSLAPAPSNGTTVTAAPASESGDNTTSAPVVSPVAAPVANVTAPAAANVSKPVAAPVRSPVAPTSPTSAAVVMLRGSPILAGVLLGWMLL